MATILNPYISFRNEARAALEFYQGVFGGELDLRPFADFEFAKTETRRMTRKSCTGTFAPERVEPDGSRHSGIDGMERRHCHFRHAQRRRPGRAPGLLAELSDGATIGEPLSQAPWGDWSECLPTGSASIGWSISQDRQAPEPGCRELVSGGWWTQAVFGVHHPPLPTLRSAGARAVPPCDPTVRRSTRRRWPACWLKRPFCA